MKKTFQLTVLAATLFSMSAVWAQPAPQGNNDSNAATSQQQGNSGSGTNAQKPSVPPVPPAPAKPAEQDNNQANQQNQNNQSPNSQSGNQQQGAENASKPLVTGLPDFTQLVKATEDSVVNIRTMEHLHRRGGSMPFDPSNPNDLLRHFFDGFGDQGFSSPFGDGGGFTFRFGPSGGNPQDPRGDEDEWGDEQGGPMDDSDADGPSVPRGVGSGFIIDKEGYIITNYHVVNGASKMTVSLNNGKEYTAKLIGSDKRTDIALIKIDAPDLKPLKIGSANKLQKGQWVVAIGSPFDLDSTVTAGIVSAINRDTGDYLPFIQSDVAVNPGNSGGPLIDMNGEVVGVNSQIISQSGGFMGISLSIPIDDAMQVVKALKTDGKVTRGQIGVMIQPMDEEAAEALKLPDAKGALIGRIVRGSPAERAGLKPGDVIVEFNGTKIEKWNDLPRLVGQYEPNKDAQIKVWRRGQTVTKTIRVENLDAADKSGKGDKKPGAKSDKSDVLGLQVAETKSSGVKVVSSEGLARDVGIRKGDIIMGVNNTEITNFDTYQKTIDSIKNDKRVVLLVRRGNSVQWIVLSLKK